METIGTPRINGNHSLVNEAMKAMKVMGRLRSRGIEYWKMKQHILRCQNCRKKVSVTAGTIFQDLRKPLRLQFQAMWYFSVDKSKLNKKGENK